MQSFLVFPCKKNIVRLDRGFRPTSKRSWARDIKKLYGNKCLLTGAIASKDVILEAHHIFCLKEYPALGFSLLNGVPLEKSVHRRFHRLYGLNASGKGLVLFFKQIEEANPTILSVREARYWIEFLVDNLISENPNISSALNKTQN